MYKNPSSSNSLIVFLTRLANFEPYRSAHIVGRELRATDRISWWTLGAAVLVFLLLLIIFFYVKLTGQQDEWIRISALILAIGVESLAFLSLLSRSVGLLLLAMRWKKISLSTFLDEVEQDDQRGRELSLFGGDVIDRAQLHLQLKLSRLERRVTSFLGDKSALLSLIVLAAPFVREAGGLWMQHVVAPPSPFFSWDTLSLYLFAFLLGLSLGAMVLKNLAARYRYQLEILSLAKFSKGIASGKKVEQSSAS